MKSLVLKHSDSIDFSTKETSGGDRTTGPVHLDDEAVYYKVAGVVPKDVSLISVVMEKERRYVDLMLAHPRSYLTRNEQLYDT
ncbi:hypothetical protein Syun_031024 [Stephania yunnanensis]|uniref:Uncharacterized protein n=1 Tax=Stephania yunnanensis TaxID=152371 RepID=A0AAP0HB71_9MAGN